MKILVADKFSENHLNQLEKLGCEVTYEPTLKAEALPQRIGPFKILIVRGKQVTGETLTASAELVLVLRAGAGVNTIDVKTASARGVFVTNCPGKNSIAVAELVFGLLLSIDRRIPENVYALRDHRWNKKEFSKADGLFGKTLGIVGVGQIGREVITRALAFGLRVIAWSRSLNAETAAELGVEWCAEMDDVFRQADIISLHVALKPETRKMVNAARLALMKRGAILINTARGELIDHAALMAALAEGRIRFGSDVFEGEPTEPSGPFNEALLDSPGFYGTHHIGASTEQAQEAVATEAVRIIRAFVRTGVVLNCVNLASRTPAQWQLVVRHYDRVGVLAFVMDQIRRAGINIQEVQNIIFEGAAAANCRIQLDTQPGGELLASIRAGNSDILGLEVQKIKESG